MKRMNWMRRSIAISLLAGATMLQMTGCGSSSGTASGSADTAQVTQAQDSTNASDSTDAAEGAVLAFVAADKTNWDKDINIGDYAYKLAINLKDDGTLTLTGTCSGRAVQEAARGGPMSQDDSSDAESTEELPELTADEMAALNFTQEGTWTKEDGYGYTITIGDQTTKTDYDTASARQYFYAVITNGDASSSLTEFEAKDVDFRKTMASDYEIFEVRDAAYIFSGTGTTMNGNASTTSVYLENDGSADGSYSQGSTPTYERGTWAEDADTHALTITLNGTEYDGDYCDISGKEGWRVTYNSTTMYTSVSGETVEYTDEDFEGAVVTTMTCPEGDYTINLTEKGFANIVNGDNVTKAHYTEDADGNISITLDGETYTSENGSLTMTMPQQRTMFGPPGASNDPVERTFTVSETGSSDQTQVDDAAQETAPAAAEETTETVTEDGAAAETESAPAADSAEAAN